ncbi:MAG: CbtB-domain containing protein [Rhizobiaceae bacterium]|jgi:cobalt transporter subunit CbtB
MSTSLSSAVGAVSTQATFAPLALAGLLGFFIIGFVGFSHMDVVHNAGHDYRHSMAFPCH